MTFSALENHLKRQQLRLKPCQGCAIIGPFQESGMAGLSGKNRSRGLFVDREYSHERVVRAQTLEPEQLSVYLRVACVYRSSAERLRATHQPDLVRKEC